MDRLHDFFDALSARQVESVLRDWPLWLHEPQRVPEGAWRTWLLMGGRGGGKTRAGAEWLNAIANRDPHYLADSGGRLALIGETFHDVRSVMIEGESGLLATARRDQRPSWHVSRRLLEWPNGTIGQVFSATDPDGLRGSQFGAAWCDELGKWPYVDLTWSMLQFCLRLGTAPSQLVTTTPRTLKLLRRLIDEPATRVSRAPTGVNARHLAPGFIEFINAEYGGTRLGRQEIDGEIIDNRQDALWNRTRLEAIRCRIQPPLRRIIVAVDPPASSTRNSDACGIIVAGRDTEGTAYVLEDATVQGVSPSLWAQKVAAVFARWQADCVIAEANQGGEMVSTILAMADNALPVRMVHARRGKWLRAEPVAMAYTRGQVRHVGAFPELEDQMCDFGPDGLSSGRSPDRLDALVWALYELLLASRPVPRIRPA